jgi:hypothetical protein
MQRERIELTPREMAEYGALAPAPGVAFDFWRRVAAARGLDPATVISEGGILGFGMTTALPWGHGRHWCWPSALKMKRRPVA